MKTSYRTAQVDGFNLFYREAGDPQAPAVLLLHGFPTSSHMFRHLIRELSGDHYVIAPDLPGFGFSDAPDPKAFAYTFAHLSEIIGKFVEQIGLKRFALYLFDYGAPTGYRLALQYPDRIRALLVQNGNAYDEGLREFWDPIKKYWADPKPENRNALRSLLEPKATRWQYENGVSDLTRLDPAAWTLDQALLDRPGNDEIQLDLFHDYRTNVPLYPKFQEFFRKYRPPALIVWGKNDFIFPPQGAEPYRRDLPQAKVVFYDTGHFALETHVSEIGREIRAFLADLP